MSTYPPSQSDLEQHELQREHGPNLNRVVYPRIPRLDIEWAVFGNVHAAFAFGLNASIAALSLVFSTAQACSITELPSASASLPLGKLWG